MNANISFSVMSVFSYSILTQGTLIMVIFPVSVDIFLILYLRAAPEPRGNICIYCPELGAIYKYIAPSSGLYTTILP